MRSRSPTTSSTPPRSSVPRPGLHFPRRPQGACHYELPVPPSLGIRRRSLSWRDHPPLSPKPLDLDLVAYNRSLKRIGMGDSGSSDRF
jgi:hypothetical protein